MISSSLKKIRSYLASSGVGDAISDCRAIIVAFSGGADSTFLLSVIKEFSSGKVIAAAHLNHNLRGSEAVRDRDFCRDFCRLRDIRLFEGSVDISAVAENNGIGTEEAGRNERYAFFDRCRKELAAELLCDVGDVLIATAHNADDNLETVVFNLSRGAGIRGLSGIRPVRDGKYVRPILCLGAKEIRDALDGDGIPYVVDSTNLADDYTRNRIRHNIIPQLEMINPDVKDTVLFACESVRQDADYLDAASEGETSSVMTREHLSSLPVPVASRVIKKMYRSVAGAELSSRHTSSLLSHETGGDSGELHLPYGVTAYYGATLEFAVEPEKDKKTEFCFPAKQGVIPLPDGKYAVGFFLSEEEFRREFGAGSVNIYKELIYKVCINDKIINNLLVRSRREGDDYFIRGHHRKLKKLECDSKMPRRLRDVIPVVCDEEGIVWVPSFPPRDGMMTGAEDSGAIITLSKISDTENVTS